MDTMDCEAVQADLAKMMKKVCDDRSPVIVTHKSGKSVVMMSLADYQSMQETAYLLNSRANARALFDSIDDLEA
jgi:antitoxin YefM